MRTLLNKIYNLKKFIGWYLGLKTKFNNKKKGFMHIGKTSGMSLLSFFTILNDKNLNEVPLWFGHEWRLKDIIKYHPGIKVSFMLRDPIERIISGFYSLQNRKGSVWKYDEALCHLFFSNVIDYFEALTQEKNILEKNKAEYLTVTNRHIKRGYEYYFENEEFIKKNSNRIYCVGSFDTMKHSVKNILGNIENFDDLFNKHYSHKHKLNYIPRAENLDEELYNKIKKYFKKEYDIYNFLLNLKNKID